MTEKSKKHEPVETGVFPDAPLHLYPPVHPANAPQPEHFAEGGQRGDAGWMDPHYAANAAAEAAVAAGKDAPWETSDPAPTPGTRLGANVPAKQGHSPKQPVASEDTTAPAAAK